ncbi:DUF892 family protein [Rhodobacteraceae bacterium 2CG4]|uniref:DUF892 family protein n=1 Tax=Halovulum marinum TaxID=2662447 RepID=A0A6L5Z2J5_9RHOB|nr:DUF892 family protein [Halovulum marinum]MSU90747.1 DUF892 family protein [Halovulum marinum]
MDIDNFRKLYLAEFEELLSAEAQVAGTLRDLAARATTRPLATAMDTHAGETESHRARLEQLFRAHDTGGERHSDGSMRAILDETRKWTGMVGRDGLGDAALIASLQRIEHYEMAVLGTLASWARRLGHEQDASAFAEILEQHKAADARLSRLAEDVVNPQAAA